MKTQNNPPTYAAALEGWLRRGDQLPRDQRLMIEATHDQQQRQQGIAPGSAGGFLTNPEIFGEVIQIMDRRDAMRRFGRVVTTQTGSTMGVPVITDQANDGEVVAENTTIPEQLIVFAQAQLGAQKYTSGEVPFSFELLADAISPITPMLTEVFARRIGRARNGAMTTALEASVATITAAALTSDAILELFHSVRPDYREHPSAAWLMNDATALLARQTPSVATSDFTIPWWQPGADTSSPDRLLGKPIIINNDLSDASAGEVFCVFGAGEPGFMVRDVQGLRIQRLEQRRALSGIVSFIGWIRGDGAQVDPDALIGLEGV